MRSRIQVFTVVIFLCLSYGLVAISLGCKRETQKTNAENLNLSNKATLETVEFVKSLRSTTHSSDFLEDHIAEILEGCGDICNTSITGKDGIFFQHIAKRVNCSALWQNAAIDESRSIGPAPDVPSKFLHLFNYNGQVQMTKYSGGLLNQQYAGGEAEQSVWTEIQIEQWAHDCANGNLNGNYGISATKSVYEALLRMHSIKGGHILVMGSENPWLESCILGAGARHVTTIEYGSIVSEHPRVSTMTPHAARYSYLNGSLPLFDAIVSYSSLEHSGLGRYGDQLNPWGDLQSVARAWCVCKPGGDMLLGVMEASNDSK
jgi:hypothetical protein